MLRGAMPAQDLSCLIDYVTGHSLKAIAALKEGRIVAIGDKADVLAVRLIGNCKAMLQGQLPHLGLAKLAQRQQGMREHFLREAIEHIALIFVSIPCSKEVHAGMTIVLSRSDARIMPCGDSIVAMPASGIEQQGELDCAIALDTGVWRTCTTVTSDKRLHDTAFEGLAAINHTVGYAQLGTHATRIGSSIGRS